jgi:abortive infection bacteriophage resistance protein
MILYLLQSINPKNTITSRFKDLLHKYPNIDVKAMGFPDNWEEEPLWS